MTSVAVDRKNLKSKPNVAVAQATDVDLNCYNGNADWRLHKMSKSIAGFTK